jgi:hypothetical protein
MAGPLTWRIWYFLVTPIRFCVVRLETRAFWRHYARIKRGELKAEGTLFTAPTRELIAKAEMIEVLSLGELAVNDPEAFDGWRIVGRTMVEDAETRKLLAERLLIANEVSGRGSRCIDGEFGLRITAGGITIGLMICFACQNAWVSGPQEYAGLGNIDGTPVWDLLCEILRRANIPIPEPKLWK